MQRKRSGRTRLILQLIVAVCLITWPASAADLIGIRVGTDMGLPALVWEHAVHAHAALTLALGYNQGFSGAHLQIGGKWYAHPDLRGLSAHLAATAGSGATPYARWSSLQVSATVGYGWAVTKRLRATIELGPAIRVVGVNDGSGKDVYSRRTSAIVHLGLGYSW